MLAQRAGDPQARLQAFAVPRASTGSIDAVLAALGDAIATWPGGGTDAPPWLQAPHPMHWIGATFVSDDLATRDARLVADYDGVVVLLRVDAEPPPR